MALRGRRAAFTCIRQLLTFSGPFFVLSLRRARMAQVGRGAPILMVFPLLDRGAAVSYARGAAGPDNYPPTSTHFRPRLRL
jgi:hypothetical protein